MQEIMKEVADEPEEVYMGVNKRSKANKYADMVEEDEMENFRRVSMTKKEKKALRNRQLDDMQEKLDNLDDDFAAIDNIVKRASKSAGSGFTDSADRDQAASKFSKSMKNFIKPKKVGFSDLKTKEVVGDKLYEGQKDKLRDKKAARKEMERDTKQKNKAEVAKMGESIQRNINYDIMKAKGLVRKRKKEDKNPRVKKRHQYEKLVKKHKTRVQDFADGKAQGVYTGEQSGLRAGVKKSTKLH
jgi:hypothetical protein